MSKNFDQIIEAIEKMSVLELAELVKTLEEKFGVSAAAMAAPAAAPAAAVGEPAEEKTEFNVLLKDMGAKKIKVIQALRKVMTLGLGDAKKMVESAPVTLVEGASKEDADKMKATLEEAGAVVELA